MRPFIANLDLAGGPYKAVRRELLQRFEHWYVLELLAFTGGNVSLAARLAQVDRAYIYKLIRRHRVRLREQAA